MILLPSDPPDASARRGRGGLSYRVMWHRGDDHVARCEAPAAGLARFTVTEPADGRSTACVRSGRLVMSWDGVTVAVGPGEQTYQHLGADVPAETRVHYEAEAGTVWYCWHQGLFLPIQTEQRLVDEPAVVPVPAGGVVLHVDGDAVRVLRAQDAGSWALPPGGWAWVAG